MTRTARRAGAVLLLSAFTVLAAAESADAGNSGLPDAEAIRQQAEAIAHEQATQEARSDAVQAPDAAAAVRVPGVWERRNRFLAVAVDNLRRHYTEIDTQGRTFDGIVDEENGNVHGLALALRWEEVPGERPGAHPFLVDGEMRISAGNTAYRGYLQDLVNGTLTPYNGNTANLLVDLRARAMLGLSVGDRLRVLPWLEGRVNWWYRDLGQYEEFYTHEALLLGAMLQWAAADDVVVEFDGGAGVMVFSHIEVPSIGLSETLGNEPVDTVSLSLRWQAGERTGLLAGVRHERSAYAGSAVSNGFFEPPSETAVTAVQLGLVHAF